MFRDLTIPQELMTAVVVLMFLALLGSFLRSVVATILAASWRRKVMKADDSSEILAKLGSKLDKLNWIFDNHRPKSVRVVLFQKSIQKRMDAALARFEDLCEDYRNELAHQVINSLNNRVDFIVLSNSPNLLVATGDEYESVSNRMIRKNRTAEMTLLRGYDLEEIHLPDEWVDFVVTHLDKPSASLLLGQSAELIMTRKEFVAAKDAYWRGMLDDLELRKLRWRLSSNKMKLSPADQELLEALNRDLSETNDRSYELEAV